MDERCVVEINVLRPADASRELTLDGDGVSEVIGQSAAGGVDVEVHFLVVVSADEERATTGEAANFNLPCADRRFLRRGDRASCEQDQTGKESLESTTHYHPPSEKLYGTHSCSRKAAENQYR